ncbi:MAG: hypothetical protein LBJ92_00560 [Holosporales bacterium]|nr:hypothetical protein [Holosporales bacterium]
MSSLIISVAALGITSKGVAASEGEVTLSEFNELKAKVCSLENSSLRWGLHTAQEQKTYTTDAFSEILGPMLVKGVSGVLYSRDVGLSGDLKTIACDLLDDIYPQLRDIALHSGLIGCGISLMTVGVWGIFTGTSKNHEIAAGIGIVTGIGAIGVGVFTLREKFSSLKSFLSNPNTAKVY